MAKEKHRNYISILLQRLRKAFSRSKTDPCSSKFTSLVVKGSSVPSNTLKTSCSDLNESSSAKVVPSIPTKDVLSNSNSPLTGTDLKLNSPDYTPNTINNQTSSSNSNSPISLNRVTLANDSIVAGTTQQDISKTIQNSPKSSPSSTEFTELNQNVKQNFAACTEDGTVPLDSTNSTHPANVPSFSKIKVEPVNSIDPNVGLNATDASSLLKTACLHSSSESFHGQLGVTENRTNLESDSASTTSTEASCRDFNDNLKSLDTYCDTLKAKYGKLTKTLGVGASGRVRLVYRQSDDKYYAVKEYLARQQTKESEKTYIKRLLKEYTIASSVQHINIVSTLDFVYEKGSGRAYQILEFCPGGDCFAAVFESRGCTVEELNCAFKQMIQGVAFLHSIGIVHRDLKLENLVFDAHACLKICDFGSAEIIHRPSETRTKRSKGLRGSLPYISPEVFRTATNTELAEANAEAGAGRRESAQARRQARSFSHKSAQSNYPPTLFNSAQQGQFSQNSQHTMKKSLSHSNNAYFSASRANFEDSFDSVHMRPTIHNLQNHYLHSTQQSMTGISSERRHSETASNLAIRKTNSSQSESGDTYIDLHSKSQKLPESLPAKYCNHGRILDFDARKADVWACGVIYLAMRHQRFPWKQADSKADPVYAQYAQLENANLIDKLERAPKDLMYKMLRPNPDARISSVDVKHDRWVAGIDCCHEDVLHDERAMSLKSSSSGVPSDDSDLLKASVLSSSQTATSATSKPFRARHRHHGIRDKIIAAEKLVSVHAASSLTASISASPQPQPNEKPLHPDQTKINGELCGSFNVQHHEQVPQVRV